MRVGANRRSPLRDMSLFGIKNKATDSTQELSAKESTAAARRIERPNTIDTKLEEKLVLVNADRADEYH